MNILFRIAPEKPSSLNLDVSERMNGVKDALEVAREENVITPEEEKLFFQILSKTRMEDTDLEGLFTISEKYQHSNIRELTFPALVLFALEYDSTHTQLDRLGITAGQREGLVVCFKGLTNQDYGEYHAIREIIERNVQMYITTILDGVRTLYDLDPALQI